MAEAVDIERVKFEEWGKASRLTRSVMDKLRDEGCTNLEDVEFLSEEEINSFNFSNMLTTRLRLAVEKLKKDSASCQSTDEDMTLPGKKEPVTHVSLIRESELSLSNLSLPSSVMETSSPATEHVGRVANYPTLGTNISYNLL